MGKLSWGLGIWCAIGAASIASAGEAVRMVALDFTRAPGTADFVNFGGFGEPVINDAGRTAFGASLFGPGVSFTNNEGIWTEGSGWLALAAREGTQTPEAPDGVMQNLWPSGVQLNMAGASAFFAGGGLWTESSGAVQLILPTSDPAPGTSDDVLFGGFLFGTERYNAPRWNSAGQAAFLAALRGPGVDSENDGGIWIEESGSFRLVAREGGAALGDGEVTFAGVGLPALNDVGSVAFVAELSGVDVGTGSDGAMWLDRNGVGAVVAREGQAPPGLPAVVRFGSFSHASINSADQVAFSGSLYVGGGSGVSGLNDTGVWAGGAGALRLVAREGDPAPGVSGDVVFNEVPFRYGSNRPPIINAAGDVAFRGLLRGGDVTEFNDESLWSEGFGALALVAREGADAPGTPLDVVFGRTSVGGFDAFDQFVLNSAGQMAFLGFVTGSGVGSNNDRGIWAQDRNGELQLIVREGDALEIAPGDVRVVQALDFIAGSGNEDGRGSGFNNWGQTAFRARFTDGRQGIFVSDLVAWGRVVGDYDDDGEVDGADLNRWTAGFATSPGADANFDGDSDGHDFLVWQRNVGAGAPPAASTATVPEASAGQMMVAGLGAMTCMLRPRRRKWRGGRRGGAGHGGVNRCQVGRATHFSFARTSSISAAL